jgi:integrase
LTRRTAFLLLLASAARVSEAVAWSAQVEVVKEVSATLVTIGGHLPKNTSRYRLHRPLPPLVIPALDSLTSDPVELRLCPVRNLDAYRQRAIGRRNGRDTLFFPYTKKSKLTTATFARWITRLIIDAYTWADRIDILPDRPTTHEIRAIATSYAAFRQVPFDKLLQLCQWQSASVFTSRYLRDLHDLSFLSSVPIVAAGVALPALTH